MAQQADIPVYQGDTFVATVSVKDETGAAADLTGYAICAHIRRGVADSDPVIVAEMTCVLTPPGTINLSLTPEQTRPLNGNYLWDLQLVSGPGIVTTILRGKVAITQEITRDCGTTVTARNGRKLAVLIG